MTRMMSPRPWRLLAQAALICSIVGVAHASPPLLPPKQPNDGIPEAYLAHAIPPGEAFIKDERFNIGAYGLYINRTFKSQPDILAPRINFDRPFSNCDDGSHLFITPRGEKVDPSPVILDAEGSLIWTPGSHFGNVYNFQVQQWKGEPYLTFWGGDNSVGGHGEGTYYMYDQHYRSVRNISTSNGLAADLHSFEILPSGTALISAYQKVQITNPQAPKGNTFTKDSRIWIWESLFQEFDMDTGEILFEWRASDYFDYSESYLSMAEKKKYAWAQDAWDWFHINMIEKDELGNYLISARHLRCVAYISGQTGQVLWRLGGRRNSFKDLSSGLATQFVGQHDAHWVDASHRYLTLFDNRADWQYEAEHVSKGTRIELDFNAMTARVDIQYVHPLKIFGFSQGSYQNLPNGNALIGYGYTGAMAEFAPNGTLLCDAYFGPSARFSSGDVQSYRNLKFNWTGLPLDPPSLVVDTETNADTGNDLTSLYMSWHGSTEIRKWWLQDSHFPNGPFGPVGVYPKTGFETTIPLTSTLPIRTYVRVIALDANENELSTSQIINIGDRATHTHEDETAIVSAVISAATATATSTSSHHLSQPPSIPSITPPSDHHTNVNLDLLPPSTHHTHDVIIVSLPPEYDDIASDAATASAEEEVEDVELMFGLGVLAMIAVILIFYASLMPRVYVIRIVGRRMSGELGRVWVGRGPIKEKEDEIAGEEDSVWRTGLRRITEEIEVLVRRLSGWRGVRRRGSEEEMGRGLMEDVDHVS